MAEAVSHFGGEDADSTVIGRECLVKLRHVTTYARLFFHQMHFDSHIRQIKRCLNAGNSATYDHYIFAHYFLILFSLAKSIILVIIFI